MKYYLFLFSLLIPTFCFCQVPSDDTSSLQYKIDKAVLEYIQSQKPIVHIKFYKEGEKVKRFKFYSNRNGATEKNNKSVYNVVTGSDSKDSILFEFRFKNTKVKSRRLPIKRLRYGGEIIGGFVKNFTLEIEKYKSDSSTYVQKNLSNYLYLITPDLIRSNPPEIYNGYQLNYCVIKDNINGWISINFEFVK